MSDGYIAAYTPITVQNWCLTNGLPYTTLIPGRTDYTYGPCYDTVPGFGERTAIWLPEAYMAQVANARVVGGWGFATVSGRILWDIALGERADRFDLVGEHVLASSRESITVQTLAVHDEPLPSGILLQSWFASNYHHWLVEHLPRLKLVEMAGVPADVPLLVDKRAMAIRQLAEALACLTDRPVIALEPGFEYRVTKLYIPSCLFGTGPNLQRGLQVQIGDVTLDSEAIDFIRSRLGPGEPQSPGRRLYIDRRAKMAPIRLKNGDEVRAIFESFGFQTISPGLLSFAEQRELFSTATVVAGESGAAMTNVVLAPKWATMICMQAERWPLSVYADLASYSGIRSLFLVGEPAPNENDGRTYQVGFVMNVDSLRAQLARALGDI